ncbi:MAG: hypothetical protein LBE82_07735 [Chitinophagaceae bacterium]|jgi:hypothetical protein|nr:hypothetical protein [Chitinophagaceae bacterium]
MKQFFVIMVLSFAGLFLSQKINAQAADKIYNIYAYYTIRMPGNIPAMPKGMEARPRVDTINFAYIETAPNAKINWEKAWKNGKSFTLHTQETPSPAEVQNWGRGTVKIMTSKPGNKLWILSFEQNVNTVELPSGKGIQPGEILLMGKAGKKIIYRTISLQTKIRGPNAV